MNFESLPRRITAEQFRTANGATDHEGVCVGGETCENPAWRKFPRRSDDGSFISSESIKPHLHTMHEGQFVVLEDGDWIVPEPDGIHYYPIKDAVMKKTYRPLPEVSNAVGS